MKTKTCAEINLERLVFNLREIQRKVFPSQVIPVVKADAYGHGVGAVSNSMLSEGVKLFAVARFQEALELRESGLTQPILIFGRLFPDEILEAIKADFRITLSGVEDIRWIEKAGFNKPAFVHVNLDTGMGRIGVGYGEEMDIINDLIRSKHCMWEGLYSHFATTDATDLSFARKQLSRFKTVVSQLQKKGVRPAMIHMANSGAVLSMPESYFDAVRPGILLYGHYPSIEVPRAIKVKQVMTLKTVVAHIRRIPAGWSVSYGRRWTAQKETRIAVLPIGYADGVRRDLSNKGEVLIRGNRYPIVGTVTMDMVMIDVADNPVRLEDEAIFWGQSSQGAIEALDVAAKINTIPYELTCGVSKRVQRIYKNPRVKRKNL
jgi:alanine racemase